LKPRSQVTRKEQTAGGTCLGIGMCEALRKWAARFPQRQPSLPGLPKAPCTAGTACAVRTKRTRCRQTSWGRPGWMTDAEGGGAKGQGTDKLRNQTATINSARTPGSGRETAQGQGRTAQQKLPPHSTAQKPGFKGQCEWGGGEGVVLTTPGRAAWS
jgi:hypothetical protein